VLDHPEQRAALAVLEDRDVAVTAAHGGLVDQQHPAR